VTPPWLTIAVLVYFAGSEVFEILAEHRDGNENSLTVRLIGTGVLLAIITIGWLWQRRQSNRVQDMGEIDVSCSSKSCERDRFFGRTKCLPCTLNDFERRPPSGEP